MIITASILILLFTLTMYKSCRGSTFLFITILQTLLIISNVGAIAAVITGNEASRLAEKMQDEAELKDKFHTIVLIDNIFVVLRDAGLNETIWIFSLRYWAISFVIPWQLKMRDTPQWFITISTTLFILGLILNFVAPLGYAYYGAKINYSLTLGSEAEIEKEY